MAKGTYSAGNLEFQIQAMAKETDASFSNLNSKLTTMMTLLGGNLQAINELRKSLSSISKMQFNSLDRLASGLRSLSTVNLKNLTGNLSSISNILEPLSQLNLSGSGTISKFANGLTKITKIDVSAFDKQIKSLTESLRPFLNELATSTPALNSFAAAMSSVKGKRTIRFTPASEDKKQGGASNFLNPLTLTSIINKVYFIRNYTKQTLALVGRMFNLAVDYSETLNLWQVAMRNNRKEAEDFVDTMNKAYGISTQTLMNYQAIFKNMLSSLGGISETTSYALSEFLTQMAIDYASLYNTSIEKAMTTFQSVLSGQVRPIRSIAGYDITETTIFQLYQQLGGTKTMRQLTQTEKRLLRIYAVFQQMESSGAVGDLNRTLGNTANQLRILSESFKELQTWFGLLVESWLKPVLPYLNAFVITLTNITKAIANMQGLELFESGMVENIEDVEEAINGIAGNLLDFDKFSSLSSKADTGNILGIDETLLSGLSKYESILSGVTSEAVELAKVWTDIFIDPDTGEFTKLTKNIVTVTTGLTVALAALAGKTLITKLFGSLSILERAKNLFNNVVSSVGGLAKGITSLSVGFVALGAAVAGAIYLFSNWDMLKNWQRWVGVIGAITTAIFGLALAVGAFHSAWSIGAATGAVVAGITAMGIAIGSAKSEASRAIQVRKNGGLIEDGLFTMNKKEIMGTFDDGTSVVANQQQIISGIEAGVYRAVRAAMNGNSGGDIILKVDGKEFARAQVGNNASALSNKYKIEFQPR